MYPPSVLVQLALRSHIFKVELLHSSMSMSAKRKEMQGRQTKRMIEDENACKLVNSYLVHFVHVLHKAVFIKTINFQRINLASGAFLLSCVNNIL